MSNPNLPRPPQSPRIQPPRQRKVRKPWQALLAGRPVFLISIVAHLLLGFLTFFFIVQRIENKRKQNFNETPLSAASSALNQIQHQVQMNKKTNAMSIPDVVQKITTTGLSAVALPKIDLPAEVTSSASSKMEGAQLSTLGLNAGLGQGQGLGQTEAVQIDVGAIVTSAFGLSNGNGQGLTGRFYDLKQNPAHGETGVVFGKYYQTLSDFVKTGWRESDLRGFFAAPKPLYLPQLFIPYMNSANAPKAFDVEKDVPKPSFWAAVYRGKFKVAHTGTYRFVGYADNILTVAIKGRLILNGSYHTTEYDGLLNHQPTETYTYIFPSIDSPQTTFKFACSEWMQLTEDEFNDIKILIGDDGGSCGYWLFVQEKDAVYRKTPEGSPILPLFKISNFRMPAIDYGCPPYDKASLGWSTQADDNGAQTPTGQ